MPVKKQVVIFIGPKGRGIAKLCRVPYGETPGQSGGREEEGKLGPRSLYCGFLRNNRCAKDL